MAGKRKQTPRHERRKFTPEFKQEAVRLTYERRAQGVALTQIARELDLRPEPLREGRTNWGVVQPRATPFDAGLPQSHDYEKAVLQAAA